MLPVAVENQLRNSVCRKHGKRTFLTHTRFLAQKACSVETHSSSMVILWFSCGYMVRPHVLVETHATSLDVLRWSESRWKHILNTYAFTISLLDFGWKHNRFITCFDMKSRNTCACSYAFGPNQQETPTRSQYFPCIFLCRVCLCSCPSVPNFRRGFWKCDWLVLNSKSKFRKRRKTKQVRID